MKIITSLMLAAVLIGSLSSCGKRAALTPPPGSTYPQEYPRN
jgi:predicted small lipoprotein YifL